MTINYNIISIMGQYLSYHLKNICHHTLLHSIRTIHGAYILFVICAPFTNINRLLVYHMVFISIMLLHWMTNNNTCIFTTVERYVANDLLGYNNPDKYYIARLIEPIYDFKQNYDSLSTLLYVAAGSLWLVSVGKLCRNYIRGENIFKS